MGLILKLDTPAGTTLPEAINAAIGLAKILSIGIEFDFNGVKCVVTNGYSFAEIESNYSKEFDKKYNKQVCWKIE